jgi:murein DD-endopeptidase MepM/ murein hydrolase activator NlpD
MYPSSVILKFFLAKSFKQSLSLLSGLSLAVSGLITFNPSASADTETNTETPVVENPVTTLKPPVIKQNTNPALRLAIPENHRTDMPTLAPRAGGKNNFIDTRNFNPPSSVVVTERRSGCQTIAQNGQLVGGNCNLAAQAPRKSVSRVAKPLPPVNLARIRLNRNPVAAQPQTVITNHPQRRQSVIANNSLRRYAPTLVASSSSVRLAPPTVIPSQVVALNPPEWNGVKLSLAPVTRAEVAAITESTTYERATRLSPTVPQSQQRTDLLFPLALPAQITSLFGWRTHPVTGNRAMHAGTDLGAPMGTPVLAAYAGEVETADWLGGYGLTVILRHLDGTQESRYAHLSEITVKPGEWVEQGAVIGRVGSTGLSTGPHLHFEWRHLTEQGWTAVDAGLHLELALDNLVQRMQMAASKDPNQG